MPRQRRILEDDAIYHVINRGNCKRILFHNEEDYLYFRRKILQYKVLYKCDIFHYCLMANHFHLVLKITKGIDLPRLMQGISQTYVKYHQQKYRETGHLFENRYKSMLISRDEYLLECGRYVERNPLRANTVSELGNYPWSSYQHYAFGRRDKLVTPSILYEEFGKTPFKRRKNYAQYVSESRPHEKVLHNLTLNKL